MALKENLRRAIRMSQELSANCRRFAKEAGSNPAALLFNQLADSLDFYLQDLTRELKKYCGP